MSLSETTSNMFSRSLLRIHLKKISWYFHSPKCSYFNRHLHHLSSNRHFLLKLYSSELQKSFKFPFSQSCVQQGEILNSANVDAYNFSNNNQYSSTPFPEIENERFHQILRKNVAYRPLMMHNDDVGTEVQNVLKKQNVSPHLDVFLSNFDYYSRFEIISRFNKLTSLSPENQNELFINKKFVQACEHLINRISDWNNKEFFCLMQVMTKFNFRSCITPILRPLRFMIGKAFDDECIKRAPQISTEQLFQSCDFFFYLRYSKYSKFCRSFFKLIQDKALSKSELILALFYANLLRQAPKDFIDKTLNLVPSIADSLTLEEMAIISLGFFKTKFQIRNIAFLSALVNKLHCEINLIDPITVSALFKGLQISTTKTVDKTIPNLFSSLGHVLDSVAKELLHFPLTTFMHVFLYFHFIHFVNNEFIDKVKERLAKEDISRWRIKDIAKISYSVANLGPLISPVPEFWDKVLEDLESPTRQVEIQRYPNCLLSTLIGMSFIGLYPEKLINKIFQPETLANFDAIRKSSRLDFRRDLFQLNESVRLECPDYNGYLLPDNFLSTISKNHEIFGKMPDIKFSFKNLSHRDAIFFDLVQSLNKLFQNKKKYSIDFFLPHFQTADIEIRVDVEGEAVPVKLWKSYENSQAQTMKSSMIAEESSLNNLLLHLVNGNSMQRIAVLLFGPNCYCRVHDQEKDSFTYHLLGLHRTKLRQLKKKGLKVVEIPYFELPGGLEQIDYLQKKIFHVDPSNT